MPRSAYFSQRVPSEQNLLEDIVIESIKIYGFDCYYMPRKIISLDTLLLEDTESKFNSAFLIEMYIENQAGFEGDGVLLSKFGLEIRHQMNLVVSSRRWNSSVGAWNTGFSNLRPSEGDLIYIPLLRGLFEIKFVDLETPFYQLSNLPVYTMKCELFEYRGEDLNTGVKEIDDIQTTISFESSYHVEVPAYGASAVRYLSGEYAKLTFPSGANGEAKITNTEILATGNVRLQLSNLKFTDSKVHPLSAGVIIEGKTTGVIKTILSISTLTSSDKLLDASPFGTNSILEKKAIEILDFTASNPFGDPVD